jgi:hypothetical protein
MGLDMYLRTNKYVSRFDYKTIDGDMQRKPNDDFKIVATLFGMEDKVDKDSFGGINISFPMGYWRKANHIHNWFVLNVQDGEDNCASYYVPLHKLEELKVVCEDVLKAKHPDINDDILPTQSGFFFGGTDYDEYYYGAIQETIDIIDRCIASGHQDFEYQSSW